MDHADTEHATVGAAPASTAERHVTALYQTHALSLAQLALLILGDPGVRRPMGRRVRRPGDRLLVRPTGGPPSDTHFGVISHGQFLPLPYVPVASNGEWPAVAW